MYTLSPSRLKLFEECPLCFWLEHRKGIKRPDAPFPSLPSGMDRILKVHFDSYTGKLPPELQTPEFDGAKVFEDIPLLDKWRNWRKGIRYEENGNILRGAVDAILARGKKLIVLDYKTRGYPLKENTHEFYRLQMDLYNFLLRKNGHETEDFSYLLFYHPDRVEDEVFHFHTDLVKIKVDADNAEKVWKDALALLDGDMPKQGDCPYCRYRGMRQEKTLLDF